MKHLFALTLIATAISSAAAAQDDQKFDLICTVQDVATGKDEGARHFHVDLTTLTACDDQFRKCNDKPYKIQMLPDMLMIQMEASVEDNGMSLIQRKNVSRADLHYGEFMNEDGNIFNGQGVCTKMPYGYVVPKAF